jgi:hypothetical protein
LGRGQCEAYYGSLTIKIGPKCLKMRHVVLASHRHLRWLILYEEVHIRTCSYKGWWPMGWVILGLSVTFIAFLIIGLRTFRRRVVN